MSCFNLEARCCKAESANLRMSCGPSDQGESQGMLSILTYLRSKMDGTPKLLNVAKRDGDVVATLGFLGWAYSTQHKGWPSSCLARALQREDRRNKERDGL